MHRGFDGEDQVREKRRGDCLHATQLKPTRGYDELIWEADLKRREEDDSEKMFVEGSENC